MNIKFIFETWSFPERNLPEPSRIFQISPCELHSTYVESFSSYICRLAEAHMMLPTIFLRRCILKNFSEETLLYLYRSFNRLNGTAEYIDMLRKEVEKATELSNLQNLTLFGLKNLFNFQQLIKRYGAWCPLCLHEWRELSQPVYIPLIWHLQTIQCCVKHAILLQTACPKCNSLQHILHRYSRVGYCERCKTWMGQEFINGHNASLEQINWAQWIKHNLNILFREVDKGTEFQRQQVISAMEYYYTSDKKIKNELKLAGFKDIQEKIIKGQLLTFPNLMAFCKVLGLTIDDLLNQVQPTDIKEITNEKFYLRRKKRDMGLIKQTLVLSINSDKHLYPTLQNISVDLNCSVNLLRRNFPGLCTEIVAKYKNNKDSEKKKTIQKLRNTIYELHRQKKYPSRRKVGEIFGNMNFNRKPMLREVWHQALTELGYEIK